MIEDQLLYIGLGVTILLVAGIVLTISEFHYHINPEGRPKKKGKKGKKKK